MTHCNCEAIRSVMGPSPEKWRIGGHEPDCIATNAILEAEAAEQERKKKKYVRTIWALRRLLCNEGWTDAEIDKAVAKDLIHPEDPEHGWDWFFEQEQGQDGT